MAEPALVADCVQAIRAAVRLPVTVKHRIGIDDVEGLRLRARLRRHGGASRLPHLHRPRAQRGAEGPVAEGEPRDPAAQVRLRVPAEARLPGARDRDQRRHHDAGPRSTSHLALRRRRDARPRGVPQPVAARRRRARRGPKWFARWYEYAKGVESAAPRHAPHARPVPRAQAGAALAPAALGRGAPAGPTGRSCCSRRSTWSKRPATGNSRPPQPSSGIGLDAGLGDDVAPFRDLGGDEAAHLVGRAGDRLGAEFHEPAAHRRVRHGGEHLGRSASR